MRVSIPDDLYDELGGTEADVLAILARATPLVDTDALVLTSRCRAELAEALGGFTVRSCADLLDRVKLLADVRVGKIRIEFTRHELQEMKHRAEKRGWTLTQYIQEIATDIKSRWFEVQVRHNPDPPATPPSATGPH